MPDQLDSIIESPGAQLLKEGFVFTEGPLWHPDGYWLFVDLFRSVPAIYRITQEGVLTSEREPSGGTNGMTLDLEGHLIMCEGDNRRITRRELDGTISVLASHWDGKRLHRPNDIVCKSDGSLYFTNPGGRIDPSEREIAFSGVHRILPDGSITVVAQDIEYPNGLAFSPDEKMMYVANTRRDNDCNDEKDRGEACLHQYIQCYDVDENGNLNNGRIFAVMASSEDGVPDGMKVDVLGRIYCTGPGGCWVFEPDGTHLGIIKLPEIPANCAWGGPDHRTMFFTARTSIFCMRMITAGVPFPKFK